ncbi:ABC transporter ATP-binding protein [Herbaspirillum sp. NPDC087042]|uniref:ABC transporter ATP-binding protein n=1 Tax=Herbaspirillum sp. NPDC087042 TaxID=3364004 RepID=UPI00381FE7B9
MACLNINNVVKAYGASEILHRVNLEVRDGEFLVLVGPSGCGKSTLLRMIAGLEDISGGEIVIGDRVVNTLEPKERDIAMVFQNYALYPHKRVRDNMTFSLKLAGKSRAEIDALVERAAEILDIRHLLGRYPSELSGGQRQRVAMGRAIVRDPAVFLFDEPLSNLDAKLRVQMRTEIKALHQRLGATMVYVTHDQIEAMTMADRIVVMRDGKVEQVGSPLELYDDPDNMFVATFLGSPAMNLLPATVEDSRLRTPGGGDWPLPQTAGLPDGKAVMIGIRPEHIILGESGMQGEITLIEPTGAETHVLIDVDGHKVTAALRDRFDLTLGDCVRIGVNPERMKIFDPDSGLRLRC